MRHLVLVLPLAACAGGPSGTPATCDVPADLDAGAATAVLDGTAWESTATWVAQGESVQVNAAPADGWHVTLVARTTDDGETVKAALDAGAFPVVVTLSDDGGGFATVYPADGDSYASDGGGGTLSITAFDGDVLDACFSFDAASDGGDPLPVTEGAVRASPFAR